MGKQRVVVRSMGKQQQNPMAAAMKNLSNMDDMPPPPVFPDKKTVIVWPLEMIAIMNYSKYIVIWPNNVDSTKTVAEGRRIAKASCCPSPIEAEMSEICAYYKLLHVREPYKGYPREPYVQGRIRVRLTNDVGEPCNPDVPNRKALMLQMGKLIPALNSRKQRFEKEKQEREEAAREEARKEAGGGGKKDKKGKKGR